MTGVQTCALPISEAELICKPCRLGFQIKDDIPVMLADEARKIPPEVEL